MRKTASTIRRANGFTMIELVSAMALLVIILGILLTALNTATNLWSNSRAQRRELPAAQHITDLIADDLTQAVTVGVTNDYPIFVLETPQTNPANSTVYVVLALLRPAPPHSPVPVSSERRSLDAVFYTYYNDTLFRHAIPLRTAGFDDPKSLGEIMHDYRTDDMTPATHNTLLTYHQDPTAATVPNVNWQWQVLAERVDTPALLATLPHAFIRPDYKAPYENSDPSQLPHIAPDLYLPPLSVSKLYTDVLPDQVDIRIRLFDAADWADFEGIRRSDPQNENDLLSQRRANLGTLTSRRIFLPQAKGSRLGQSVIMGTHVQPQP